MLEACIKVENLDLKALVHRGTKGSLFLDAYFAVLVKLPKEVLWFRKFF